MEAQPAVVKWGRQRFSGVVLYPSEASDVFMQRLYDLTGVPVECQKVSGPPSLTHTSELHGHCDLLSGSPHTRANMHTRMHAQVICPVAWKGNLKRGTNLDSELALPPGETAFKVMLVGEASASRAA